MTQTVGRRVLWPHGTAAYFRQTSWYYDLAPVVSLEEFVR
jgi:hypothetical protein